MYASDIKLTATDMQGLKEVPIFISPFEEEQSAELCGLIHLRKAIDACLLTNILQIPFQGGFYLHPTTFFCGKITL